MAKINLLSDILLSLLRCFLMIDALVGASFPYSKPNCVEYCGNIRIPFPFGMDDSSECFLDKWYQIECRNGTTPFLKMLNLHVLNISLGIFDHYRTGRDTGTTRANITVNFPIIYSNPSCSTNPPPPSLKGSPFAFSHENAFTAVVGCSDEAMISRSDHSFVGCKCECRGGDHPRSCQTDAIPFGLQRLTVEFSNNTKDATGINGSQCSYAFLADESWLASSSTVLESVETEGHAPVAIQWAISNTGDLAKELDDRRKSNFICYEEGVYDNDTRVMRTCRCAFGYEGNPYLKDGCQDIDECKDPNLNSCPRRCVNTQGRYHCVDPKKTLKLILIGIGSSLGALFFVLLGWWLYQVIKKREEKKLKVKHFKRNGGLILQQLLLSSGGNVPNSKLFNQKEIEMATENFSESRVLGKGGQGTVYKGMLKDGRIVAIKKGLVIDEEKVAQFINEVIILTQISHRNIVQLLGCCLETEIPLLVYEFVSNGNLYDYLHGSDKEGPVSWKVRLQLTMKIAGALFYLHSAASIPVYHRDIKTTNILLDEKYEPKIADFGTSRLISLDQTHVTTLVQGTIGYLDPEYFQTSQFTDKSDVYSFGVVLVELLTRQKPILKINTKEGISLAAYFVHSMEDGHLFDILDAEVLNQGTEEEILNVANLAKRCLYSHGRSRPTMREVIIELMGIKKLQSLSNIKECEENHE